MDDKEDTYYGEDFSDEDWEDYNGEEGVDRKSWYFKLNKKKYEEVYKND